VWRSAARHDVTPPPLERVYETVLYGDDLAGLVGFYRDVLELRLVDPMDELGAAFRLADGAILLVFDRARSSQAGRTVPSHGTEGPGHIAFTVPESSLDDWRAAFAAAGVEIEQEVDWRRGGHSVYVRDPAGNSVELVSGEIWAP
jgi:catechol 2,3-dioxygenase-like lactoylglutathione lyase family enzyme